MHTFRTATKLKECQRRLLHEMNTIFNNLLQRILSKKLVKQSMESITHIFIIMQDHVLINQLGKEEVWKGKWLCKGLQSFSCLGPQVTGITRSCTKRERNITVNFTTSGSNLMLVGWATATRKRKCGRNSSCNCSFALLDLCENIYCYLCPMWDLLHHKAHTIHQSTNMQI